MRSARQRCSAGGGRLVVGEAQRLRSIEEENGWLKRLAIGLRLDEKALKGIVSPQKQLELADLRAEAAFAIEQIREHRASKLAELERQQSPL